MGETLRKGFETYGLNTQMCYSRPMQRKLYLFILFVLRPLFILPSVDYSFSVDNEILWSRQIHAQKKRVFNQQDVSSNVQ